MLRCRSTEFAEVENAPFVGLEAALAGFGGAAIGIGDMWILRCLLGDCEFGWVLPYFGFGGTFHDDETWSNVALRGFFFF